MKNCEGVFCALANRALCLARGDGAFQASEGLTNLPVLSLQHPGLDVLPETEAEAAPAAQPDPYERRGGRIVLRIRDGRLSLACQDAPGFGVASEIDWLARPSLDDLERELPA